MRFLAFDCFRFSGVFPFSVHRGANTFGWVLGAGWWNVFLNPTQTLYRRGIFGLFFSVSSSSSAYQKWFGRISISLSHKNLRTTTTASGSSYERVIYTAMLSATLESFRCRVPWQMAKILYSSVITSSSPIPGSSRIFHRNSHKHTKTTEKLHVRRRMLGLDPLQSQTATPCFLYWERSRKETKYYHLFSSPVASGTPSEMVCLPINNGCKDSPLQLLPLQLTQMCPGKSVNL